MNDSAMKTRSYPLKFGMHRKDIFSSKMRLGPSHLVFTDPSYSTKSDKNLSNFLHRPPEEMVHKIKKLAKFIPQIMSTSKFLSIFEILENQSSFGGQVVKISRI